MTYATRQTAVPASSLPARRRKGRLVAGVSLAVLLLALLAGELVLRAYVWSRGWTANCYAASLDLFRPHRELGYDLRPNFRLESGVFHIDINAQGLRGPELGSKRPGIRRIAFLGGSAAFGYLVSDGAEAARRVEAELRRRGADVEVLNAGVPGYNLFQSIPRFRDSIAPHLPDIAVLYLGWNDLTYVVSDEPYARAFRVRPVAPAWERLLGRSTLYGFTAYRLLGAPVRLVPAQLGGVTPTEAGKQCFRKNLDELADAIAECRAHMVVCAPASAAHRRASERLRASLTGNPAQADAVVQLGEWLHEELADFARRRGAVLLDAYESIPPTETYLGDYIHLTAAGEQLLAQLLANGLEPLLAETRPIATELRQIVRRDGGKGFALLIPPCRAE